MNDLKPIGMLCEKLNGEYIFVPISVATRVSSQREKPESGIVKQPTPEEARIAKEKETDYSLKGVLKKTKKDEVL